MLEKLLSRLNGATKIVFIGIGEEKMSDDGVGPYIVTDLDTQNLDIELFVNSRRRQHSSTSNLIFNTGFLVSFISRVMTLMPGDIIATGTPPGVGSLSAGDEVEVRISGIGSLKNLVISAR